MTHTCPSGQFFCPMVGRCINKVGGCAAAKASKAQEDSLAKAALTTTKKIPTAAIVGICIVAALILATIPLGFVGYRRGWFRAGGFFRGGGFGRGGFGRRF